MKYTDIETATANLETANNVLTWYIEKIKRLQRELTEVEAGRARAFLKWQDAFDIHNLKTQEGDE